MIYVTNVLSFSMLKQLVEGNSIKVGKEYNIDHINNLGEFKVCIHNPCLVRTLQAREVQLDKGKPAQNVSLVPGDVLLAINPSEKIDTLKNDDILPDHISFKLEEYEIIK